MEEWDEFRTPMETLNETLHLHIQLTHYSVKFSVSNYLLTNPVNAWISVEVLYIADSPNNRPSSNAARAANHFN